MRGVAQPQDGLAVGLGSLIWVVVKIRDPFGYPKY